MNPQAPFFSAGEHLAIDLPGARALFTTRRGGHSAGPYESLNLGLWTDDRREAVERNRAELAAQFDVTLARIRQVHGSRVLALAAIPDPSAEPVQADGHATALPGIAPLVLTADCLPIAIAGGGAVGVVHAGWRGLADGVIAEGVRAIHELGSGGQLAAAIGPGAGRCCYEVGDEVHAAFESYSAAARAGRNLDLKAIARAQLLAAGVETVHDAGLCTICAEEMLFFSHRRDHGVTGRQAGLAWLT